jgi:hypothetical protein
MDNQVEKQELSAEQSADLAALVQAAGENEPAPGAGEQAAPQMTIGQELAAAITMAASMLRPALPSVAALYTPEVAAGVGEAIGAVCTKHGWLQGGVMGRWGEEIMCLAIVGPLAYATFEAGRTDIAALKQKAKIQKPDAGALAAPSLTAAEPPAAPGQKTVQIGAAVPA